MKNILIVVVFSGLFFYGCADKKEEAKKVLYDHVMEVHDEVMPKMSDISKYKKQLKSMIANLQAEDSVGNSEAISKMEHAIQGLDNSHDEMMGWMREFDGDLEGKTNEEIMKYLNSELEKIKTVAQVTNDALKEAEAILSAS